MRGSVLSRTDQELEDIAAYYASQPGYLTPEEIRLRREDTEPVAARSGGPQQGGPPQGSAAPPKFDHSDHIARYNSMLSLAIHSAAQIDRESRCFGLPGTFR